MISQPQIGLLSTLLLSLAMQSPSAAPSTCAEGPFSLGVSTTRSPSIEEEIPQLSQRDQAIPPEIERIRSGLVAFYQGAFINDGLISWYAFDAESGLFVAVLGKAGPKLQQLPDRQRLASNQFIRHTLAAGYPRAEFVTLQMATAGQREELGCLLNDYRPTSPASAPRLPPTDLLRFSLTLVRQGESIAIEDRALGDRLRDLLSAPVQAAIQQAYGQ